MARCSAERGPCRRASAHGRYPLVAASAAILAKRSARLVVAMLACSRAGSIFAVLDSADPALRTGRDDRRSCPLSSSPSTGSDNPSTRNSIWTTARHRDRSRGSATAGQWSSSGGSTIALPTLPTYCLPPGQQDGQIASVTYHGALYGLAYFISTRSDRVRVIDFRCRWTGP